MSMDKFLSCDFFVAGAGPSGIVAALEAGRLGLRTLLVEKEMWLGGNAGPNLGIAPTATQVSNPYYNETGIIEELEEKVSSAFLRMKPTIVNYNINPQLDTFFSQELRKNGVQILRRHIPINCEIEDSLIRRVELMNIDTMDHITVCVEYFAMDCTGDACLAQLCGAEVLMGRESFEQTGERSAPEKPDALLSAASLTALVVDTGMETPFIPPEGTPEWNPEKPDSRFDPKQKVHFLWQVDGGGENDDNHPFLSPQALWERLVYRIYSQWNYIKNIEYPDELKTHQLVWISSVLGKRETKRIVSRYMLSQTDIESTRSFEDAIGFGGGYLDEHLPSFDGGYEVRYYNRPLPYDIPFRSVCSINISNLFAGGRCIGVTHLAFTSTRLMRTICMLAQSTAVAVWMCTKNGWTVDDLLTHMDDFHRELRKRDVFLLGHTVHVDDLCRSEKATVSASSSARPKDHSSLEFVSSNQIMAIYEYPKEIRKLGFLVRAEKAGNLRLRLGYGETPKQEYADPPKVIFNEDKGIYEVSSPMKGIDEGAEEIASVRGCVNFFVRKDIPVLQKILLDTEVSVPAGYVGIVSFNVDVYSEKLPDRRRDLWGQALMAELSGDVKLGVTKPVVDTCESITAGIPNIEKVPVFDMVPNCRWGSPSNAITGQIARDGHSFCDAWISDPSQSMPQYLEIDLGSEKKLSEIILHFDSTERLWKENYIFMNRLASPRLVKGFAVEVQKNGSFECIFKETDNRNRYRRINAGGARASKIRITVTETWGSPSARICSIEAY